MDGRGVCLFVVSLTLCGCVIPKQLTVPDRGSSPTAQTNEMPDPVEPVNLNPFASKPKREPTVELDTAKYFEGLAKENRNKPEQQQRYLDLARKAYQEILIYDGKCLPAHLGLGRVYVAERDLARAEVAYRKGLEVHPKSAELLDGLSTVYSIKGDYNGAMQLLNKALEFDPENRAYAKRLGVNLVLAGQHDRGADVLSRAFGRPAGYLIVAKTLALTNRPDEARHHAQLALQANPNSGDAQAFLADLDRGRAPAEATPIANVGLQFVSDE